jgi:ATP-dependent DNA ligase
MAWLLDIAWPISSAVFDGEACAGDGHEGIQSVFIERERADGAMALVVFDVMHVGHTSVMREPWRDRRKRLEDLVADRNLPRIAIVPVTEDAPRLYETLGRDRVLGRHAQRDAPTPIVSRLELKGVSGAGRVRPA